MENITVEKWISESETGDQKVSIGGLGGFFQDGMRWEDYIKDMRDECKPYAEAIRKSVIEKGIRHTGEDHQNAVDGVPLFSDGTIGSFSWRAWGDLMAAIWSTEENKDYSYMSFYM